MLRCSCAICLKRLRCISSNDDQAIQPNGIAHLTGHGMGTGWHENCRCETKNVLTYGEESQNPSNTHCCNSRSITMSSNVWYTLKSCKNVYIYKAKVCCTTDFSISLSYFFHIHCLHVQLQKSGSLTIMESWNCSFSGSFLQNPFQHQKKCAFSIKTPKGMLFGWFYVTKNLQKAYLWVSCYGRFSLTPKRGESLRFDLVPSAAQHVEAT